MYEIKLRGGGRLLGDMVTYEPEGRKAAYLRLERSMGTAWLPMGIVKKVKEVDE
jgi:hypothetical protein